MQKFSWVGIAGTLFSTKKISYSPDLEKIAAHCVFDLASLTKVLYTVPLILFLEKDQKGFLNKNLGEIFPEIKLKRLKDISIQRFLEHRSGLQDHLLLKDYLDENFKTQELFEILEQAFFSESEKESLEIYSDLGFFVLHEVIKKYYSESAEENLKFIKKKISYEGAFPSFEPLHGAPWKLMKTTTDLALGSVNDENAQFLGGASAHAGLFSDSLSLWSYLESLFKCLSDDSSLKEFVTIPELWEKRFYCGWDRPSGENSQAGKNAPQGVIGHLGYTGTAFWFHPDSKEAGLLLSNRIILNDSLASQESIKKMRRDFFSQLWAS